MQLGITLRINGATPKLSMDEVLEAERLGYVSVWSRRGLGHRCGVAGRLGPGAHHADQGRHSDHADASAHAGLRRDDRDDAERPFRRPLPARGRPVRTAGDRGLARRAVWQAARPHQGIYRDRPQDPGARRTADLSGRALSDPLCRTRLPPGWASRCAASCMAIPSHEDLHGVDHAGRIAHRRRSIGRHAADLVLAGASGPGSAADPRRHEARPGNRRPGRSSISRPT